VGPIRRKQARQRVRTAVSTTGQPGSRPGRRQTTSSFQPDLQTDYEPRPVRRTRHRRATLRQCRSGRSARAHADRPHRSLPHGVSDLCLLTTQMPVRWSLYGTGWRTGRQHRLTRNSGVRHAGCRCLAWLTFSRHSSSAPGDDVHALGSPPSSPRMILKSKYLYNLRPDRDSNAGPTA